MQRSRTNHQSPAMEALKDQAGIMGASVRDIGEIVKDAVTEKLSALREGGKDRVAAAREGLEDQIESRPFTSVFVAAGVGLLVGLLVRRK
jgi:ElaB/YqjD/DUF883 family membrane-anchored ribosome-binding protein